MFKKISLSTLIVMSFMLSGCFEDVVFKAIENHPEKFFEAVKNAESKYKDILAKKQQKEEKKALEDEFKNPKKPDLSGDRVVFGNEDAPITIVEYSDFQCPFCRRGYQTISRVLKDYDGKVKVIYKNLPLDIHPMAMPAAKFFEAIAMQSHEKAEKFYNIIFEEQDRLRSEKEAFLKDAAKKAGANVKKVLKDIKSAKVKDSIEADMKEAQKFGFSGTPGFLINGVSVRGAYPFDHFKMIIDKLLAKEGK